MKMKYNARGEEIPDTTKPELPLGFKKPESLAEQVRRLVRSEHIKMAAQAAGVETWEEADDFDVGDDYDPRSPFEEIFDPTWSAPETTPVEEKKPSAKAKDDSSKEPKKGGKKSPPSQGSGDTGPQSDDE